MSKTEKGKELERLFKNQETPEESKCKMNEGFSRLKKAKTEPLKEEFVAKSFEDIHTGIIDYCKRKLAMRQIKIREAGPIRNWFHAEVHCKRPRIVVHISSRENERMEWDYEWDVSVCPCCGDIKLITSKH